MTVEQVIILGVALIIGSVSGGIITGKIIGKAIEKTLLSFKKKDKAAERTKPEPKQHTDSSI